MLKGIPTRTAGTWHYEFGNMYAQKDDPDAAGLYLPLRPNPYVYWAGFSFVHYTNLGQRLTCMLEEYHYRFGKRHGVFLNTVLMDKLFTVPDQSYFINGPWDPVAPTNTGSGSWEFRVTVDRPAHAKNWVTYYREFTEQGGYKLGPPRGRNSPRGKHLHG